MTNPGHSESFIVSPRMIVIDYSSVSITQIMGALQGDNTAVIDVSAFRHLMLFALVETKKKYGPRFGDLVIACDNKNYWRRDIYPNYKCFRKKTKEDQGYDWDMIHDCMNTLEGELREVFPYPVINVPGAEADDVGAILAEHSQTFDLKEDMFGDGEPKPFLIISADGDNCQLQKYKNVRQMSPYTKEQVLPKLTKGKEKVRVPLDEYVLDHLLTGDAGDSIPNILTGDDFFRIKLDNPEETYRQKPVTAKIKEFYKAQWDEHGEIREFRSEEEKSNFMRNMRLIHFDNIPQDVKDRVLAEFKAQSTKDSSMLLDYFIEHRLKNLQAEIENF